MFGLPISIIRPSQFYGGGKDQQHQPFLTSIINNAANNQDIFLYGSNDALRNFIHIADVAEIIARVVKHKILGTYKCMSTKNVSYSEVAKAAIAAFGSNSSIKFLKEHPDIIDNVFELDDRLYQLIDYFPQIPITLGMKMEADYRRKVS